MYLKGPALLLFLILAPALCGQDYSLTDTVRIGEVTITVKSTSRMASFLNADTIRHEILARQEHRNLGQVLSLSSRAYVKSYGPGGISTISIRGTSPGHTVVTWNGIPVNNSMLGQSDLSLMPAGIADEVRISYGASSMQYFSGGIGGSVELASKPEWEKGTKTSLSAGAGSFGHYNAAASVRTATGRLESSTSFYVDISENDFPYLNRTNGGEPSSERRSNNETSFRGLLQNIYFRNNGALISARLWYQDADRNLPGSLLAGNSYRSEQQQDVSLRTQVSYEKTARAGKVSLAAAYINDKLAYTNRQASIDSRNSASSVIVNGKAEYYPDRATTITVMLNEELNRVVSNNYDGVKTRSTTTLSLVASRDLTGRLGASVLLRETLSERSFQVPDFSGTLRYMASLAKNVFLNASFSRNSKLPSMNDMFWYPGGNPGLKSEYAYQYEAGADWNHSFAGMHDLKIDLNLFHNRIHDMIQWLPGRFSYWEPVNIRNTSAAGAEVSALLSYGHDGIRWSVRGDYSFTSARIADNVSDTENRLTNQLVYVPVNKAEVLLSAAAGQFSAAFGNTYTGKRFTTADNSLFLPSYWESTVSVAYKRVFKQLECNVYLSVDNIFNSEYQLVAYFPMPGRSFNLKAGFTF